MLEVNASQVKVDHPLCANLHICRAPRNVKQVKTWVKLRLPFLFSAGFPSLFHLHCPSVSFTWPVSLVVVLVFIVGVYMVGVDISTLTGPFPLYRRVTRYSIVIVILLFYPDPT